MEIKDDIGMEEEKVDFEVFGFAVGNSTYKNDRFRIVNTTL
jgi:hypothetical protein